MRKRVQEYVASAREGRRRCVALHLPLMKLPGHRTGSHLHLRFRLPTRDSLFVEFYKNSLAAYFYGRKPIGPIPVNRCDLRPKCVVGSDACCVDASESHECADFKELSCKDDARNQARESFGDLGLLKKEFRLVAPRRGRITEGEPLWPA